MPASEAVAAVRDGDTVLVGGFGMVFVMMSLFAKDGPRDWSLPAAVR